MISPGQWFDYRAVPYVRGFNGEGIVGTFDFRTCRHLHDNIYHYVLLGAKDLVEEFSPDWLYIQAEPGSKLVEEALQWKVEKRALFTWENIAIKGLGAIHLPGYDLIVCGNPDAMELVKPYNNRTCLLLQVGVGTDHFQARPGIPRNVDVAYIGRPAMEKGLLYLIKAWPTVKVLSWKDFKELPWEYSQVKVVVAYSQDVLHWKEQAPNYVLLEALSCGCRCVASDTAAMKFWLEGCPEVVMVEGHEQPDDNLRLDRIVRLREGIQKALEVDIGTEGRNWVMERFGNPVVARELLEVLEDA